MGDPAVVRQGGSNLSALSSDDDRLVELPELLAQVGGDTGVGVSHRLLSWCFVGSDAWDANDLFILNLPRTAASVAA